MAKLFISHTRKHPHTAAYAHLTRTWRPRPRKQQP